jgi:hypothetical protein
MLYQQQKQKVGGQKASEKGVGQNVPPVRSSERIAKELGVSEKMASEKRLGKMSNLNQTGRMSV